MIGIARNVYNLIKTTSSYCMEDMISVCYLAKGYCSGKVAKDLVHTTYNTDNPCVVNVFQYICDEVLRKKDKESTLKCSAKLIFNKLNLIGREKCPFLISIPIETLEILCATKDICKIQKTLHQLEETKIYTHKECNIYFFSIKIEEFDGESRSFLISLSPQAYSFISNQDIEIQPEKEKDFKGIKKEKTKKVGRKKSDLTKVKGYIKDKFKESVKKDECVVMVSELRNNLNCKNSYKSNSSFITIKFGHLCQELGVDIVETIKEGKKVVSLRLKRINK